MLPGAKMILVRHTAALGHEIPQIVIGKPSAPGAVDLPKDAVGAQVEFRIAGIEAEIDTAQTILPPIQKADGDQLLSEEVFGLQAGAGRKEKIADKIFPIDIQRKPDPGMLQVDLENPLGKPQRTENDPQFGIFLCNASLTAGEAKFLRSDP